MTDNNTNNFFYR